MRVFIWDTAPNRVVDNTEFWVEDQRYSIIAPPFNSMRLLIYNPFNQSTAR